MQTTNSIETHLFTMRHKCEVDNHILIIDACNGELTISLLSQGHPSTYIFHQKYYQHQIIKPSPFENFTSLQHFIETFLLALSQKSVQISPSKEIIIKYAKKNNEEMLTSECILQTKQIQEKSSLEKSNPEGKNIIHFVANFQKVLNQQGKADKISSTLTKQTTRFNFVVDEDHLCFKYFSLEENKITKIGNSVQRFKFISKNAIPLKGSYCFSIKFIHSKDSKVLIGLVDDSTKDQERCSGGIEEMYYLSTPGTLRCNEVDNENQKELQKGQIMTVMVDNQNHLINWLIENEKVAECKMPQQLWQRQLYPFVQLRSKGDCVELINEIGE